MCDDHRKDAVDKVQSIATTPGSTNYRIAYYAVIDDAIMQLTEI